MRDLQTIPETPKEKRRLFTKRGCGVGALIFLLFLLYRVFGVYTVRSPGCEFAAAAVEPPRILRRMPDGTEINYPPREAGTRGKSLLVMMFNIQGHATLVKPHHLEQIAEVIRRHKPDVVGLNEVHRRTWQARFGDHVNELARMTGMNVAYGQSFVSLGGQFGNAILTRGKILKAETHPLPGMGEPRTLLECRISFDGAPMTFFVTHLAAWRKFTATTRTEQIACLTEHLRRSEHPFVLVGDLNAAPEDEEMKMLLRGELVQMCGLRTESTHRVMNERIDYIFADLGWGVRRAAVVKEGPSDHWPQIAELVWHRADVSQATKPPETAVQR